MAIACQRTSVERDREKLVRPIRRINELLEAKNRRLQPSSVKPVSKCNGIFQIAYHEMLLIARAELLKDRGYEVSSALGNDHAKRVLANRSEMACPWSLLHGWLRLLSILKSASSG